MARQSELFSKRRSKLHPLPHWKTFYTGISVIANRLTPSHRDVGGFQNGFDLLLSLGTHDADLLLDDIQVSLKYGPGSVVALCGKLLRHKVPVWQGKDRVCYVFFQKDKVFERFTVRRPQWVKHTSYFGMMDRDFCERSGFCLDEPDD